MTDPRTVPGSTVTVGVFSAAGWAAVVTVGVFSDWCPGKGTAVTWAFSGCQVESSRKKSTKRDTRPRPAIGKSQNRGSGGECVCAAAREGLEGIGGAVYDAFTAAESSLPG
jgi:hypothetical protein